MVIKEIRGGTTYIVLGVIAKGEAKLGARVSHLASSCPVYLEYSDTHCKKCKLLHKNSVCRQAEAQVHLGELQMDQDVPAVIDTRDHVEGVDPGQEVYVEQEEFLSHEEQDEEFPEEKAWDLEEEFECLDQEEGVSPFYLF